MKKFGICALAMGALIIAAGPATAHYVAIDLTHPTPSFKPMEGAPMTPDMNQPWGIATAIPSFGQQTVLSIAEFPTNQGRFDLGLVVTSEHHGTHMDTPGHYVNNAETQDPNNPVAADRPRLDQLDGDDLTGRIVLIDISGRVSAELDKNGGRPSPDTSVTDFSDDSGNVVTADDIDRISDKLANGVWLVLHQGWSKFYFQGADFAKDPYINGWNFPGLTPAAIDRIIEIEDAKGIRINGIMSDVIGVETGENSVGNDDKFSNSFYAHVFGLQRGWKFVENGANLEQLAQADNGKCTLVVGAPKHVGGRGGPSRIIALCDL